MGLPVTIDDFQGGGGDHERLKRCWGVSERLGIGADERDGYGVLDGVDMSEYDFVIHEDDRLSVFNNLRLPWLPRKVQHAVADIII